MSTGELFRGLIDDAGLFPPARLPMSEAVAAHLRNRGGPYAPLVGRFLVPASRFEEFVTELEQQFDPDTDAAVRIGVIADIAASELVEAFRDTYGPTFTIELFEIAVPSSDVAEVQRVASVLHSHRGEVYLELPRTAGWVDDLTVKLSVIKAFGLSAKFRTGGVVAEAFPSEAEVASFIQAAAEARVSFKLTAGLHNALRHTDPVTGFEHHGFLNFALAVAAPDDAERWLSERDGAVVAAAIAAIDGSDATAVRSQWRAYGSCSIDEPVADLLDLGLLETT